MPRIRNMGRDRDATRNSTVPMGLQSFILTAEIAAKIIPLLKANADAVTKNMIFFTRYLEKRCVDERNNPVFFRDTIGTPNAFRSFYRECVANRLIQEMLDRELEPMERRIACMDNALIQYFTNMKNHIQMNLKKFLVRWLKYHVGMTGKQANDSAAKYLNPDNELVMPDRWRGDVDFKQPERNTMSFIPIFMEWAENLTTLQQNLRREHIESGSKENFLFPRGLVGFGFIPVKKIQRNMCSYDLAAIYELWAQFNKQENALRKSQKSPTVPTGQKPKASDAASRELFGRFFNLSKVERVKCDGTTKRKFAHHVMTDGVKVCVMVTIPKVAQIVPRPRTQTTLIIGDDPGCRVVQGLNIVDPNSGYSENVLLNSKTHFNNAGLFARRNKYKQITGAFETEQATKLQQRNIADRVELRKFQMESFDERYDLYSKPKVLRLKFDNGLRSRKAEDQFVSSHVAAKGRTEVCYGGGWKGLDGIKGYIPPPQKAMYEAFKRHPRTETRVVHEWRTSKCCCRCNQFLTMPDRRNELHWGHRWVYCGHCKISMNRDANAGQNMWQKGLREKKEREDIKKKEEREKVISHLSAQVAAKLLPVPRLVKLQRRLGALLAANRLPHRITPIQWNPLVPRPAPLAPLRQQQSNQIVPIQWNPLVPRPAPLAPLQQQQRRKKPTYILVEQPRREGFHNRRWLVEIEEPEDITAEVILPVRDIQAQSVRPVRAAKRRAQRSPPPSQDESGRPARVSRRRLEKSAPPS